MTVSDFNNVVEAVGIIVTCACTVYGVLHSNKKEKRNIQKNDPNRK